MCDKISFFNFFTNARMPSVEEMKKLDYEVEKELGAQLDTEYEIGLELIEEVIPHALEYFVGVTHDTEEYMDYMNEQLIEESERKKAKKAHKK